MINPRMDADGNMKPPICQCAVYGRITKCAIAFPPQVVQKPGGGLSHVGVIRAGNSHGGILPHDSAPRASPADISLVRVISILCPPLKMEEDNGYE